jgi:hypothetical protein
MTSQIRLLDIFSYSCMNCLRSLEYIKKLDRKYRKYGLKTIIVHVPEWNFEKNKKNILRELKKQKTGIPVIIDNNGKTTKKFKIDFWPSQVLIKNNKTEYKHIGEGHYRELEKKIISLLKINTKMLFSKEPGYSKLPTIYCGKRKKGKILKLNGKKEFGVIYAKGKYKQEEESLKTGYASIITAGKTVNFVAESIKNGPANVKISINGRHKKNITIKKPRLYQLIKAKNHRPKELVLEAKGLKIYSFSFE